MSRDLREVARRLVADWPELTAKQRDRLFDLLPPVTRREAAA